MSVMAGLALPEWQGCGLAGIPRRQRILVSTATTSPSRERARHRSQHIGWLRAEVLGANDGIVSTAIS